MGPRSSLKWCCRCVSVAAASTALERFHFDIAFRSQQTAKSSCSSQFSRLVSAEPSASPLAALRLPHKVPDALQPARVLLLLLLEREGKNAGQD